MSDIGAFHAALSRLAHARAEHTIQFILEEARRIDQRCTAVNWRDLDGRIREANLSTIADMLSDPQVCRCVIQPDGEIVNINRQFAGRLGKCRLAMLGTCMWSYFPPAMARYRRRVMEKAIDTQRPQSTMDRALTGYPLESVVVPMANGCAMVLFRDVCHQRVFQEAESTRVRLIE